jgi:hypothetical protein
MQPPLPPLKPISIKDRVSVLFVERGQLDFLNGSIVLVDKIGVRTHIPVRGVACLMLEPGIRVSHAAAVLASPRRRWAYEHARIHEEDIRKVLGKTAGPGKHVTGKVDHA